MPLSIPQIILGTQVALTHAEDGETLLPIERRGVIVAVDTARKLAKNAHGKTVIVETVRNGNPATGVDKIWVRFKKGQEPVCVKNCQLTLVHEATRKAFDEIKRDDAVKRAAEIESKGRETAGLPKLSSPNEEDVPIVVPEPPVVVQELGVPEGRGLSAEEIRALESDAPEQEYEEKPMILKRVFPKA